MNITGRFSVSIVGLTYNLVDDSVVDYPTLATTWAPSVLLAKNATDFDLVEKSLLSYLDLNMDLETLHSFLIGHWFDGETGGMVNLKYYLLDFSTEKNQEIYGTSSDHAVHSSANCTMLRLEGHKYWRDYNSDDQISYGMLYEPLRWILLEAITKLTPILETDWKDESNGDTIAEVLRVLESKNAWPRQGTGQVTWAAPFVGESNGSSVTYVVYHDTAWECTSRFFETLEPGRGPHPKPLFDSATLFLLPIVERIERGVSEPTGGLVNSCGGPAVGRTASIAYRSFADLKSRSSPSIGVQTLNFYQNGTGGSAAQKMYYNIYVAGLVARLPMATIAYGDQIYPHVPKDRNANLTINVETTLKVKWGRVGIAAGIIVGSQILAIAVVLYYCRNVYVREDSYLTTAELLNTALNKIDHGSTMTMEELGDALGKALEGPVSYGTIPSGQGDQPSVALGREVDYNFPGFPPFRKRSVFQRRNRS
ncbi:hypothetical protein B9Z19DRAFT_1067671 [Tuber borchii]|uniref:Uncharacterized protein n=1 Tax=Tuber borchii TaxID=42251 RepID=A0A2T6ZHY5_TUBBO|nr:hypothetical protein B9Z19DRAFT_1067671 [Tuber borchii]